MRISNPITSLLSRAHKLISQQSEKRRAKADKKEREAAQIEIEKLLIRLAKRRAITPERRIRYTIEKLLIRLAKHRVITPKRRIRYTNAITDSIPLYRERLPHYQAEGISISSKILEELAQRFAHLPGLPDNGAYHLLGSYAAYVYTAKEAASQEETIDPAIDLLKLSENEETVSSARTMAEGLDNLFKRLGPPPPHLRSGDRTPLLLGGGGAAE
ncbi:hypothetical protein ABZ470_26435 [Streptosporangium sp. NPDC020072]|uniref:hypothetical protein n=1 Tax=Streptosporangium sp. NPDC020072 TaxID=3154788 RepID=UPI0034302EED